MDKERPKKKKRKRAGTKKAPGAIIPTTNKKTTNKKQDTVQMGQKTLKKRGPKPKERTTVVISETPSILKIFNKDV